MTKQQLMEFNKVQNSCPKKTFQTVSPDGCPSYKIITCSVTHQACKYSQCPKISE